MIANRVIGGNGGLTASIFVTGLSETDTVYAVTPSGKTISAVWNGTEWVFSKLDEYGTYTVTASDGTNTSTQDVLIDMAIQYDIQISLDNILWLYKDGDECEDVTGGWDYCWNLTTYQNGFIIKNSDNITFGEETNGYGNLWLFTSNLIDVTGYNTLHCIVDVTSNYYSNSSYKNSIILTYSPNRQTHAGNVSIPDNTPSYEYKLSNGEIFSGKELILDISDVSEHISALIYENSGAFGDDRITAVLHKMWLE